MIHFTSSPRLFAGLLHAVLLLTIAFPAGAFDATTPPTCTDPTACNYNVSLPCEYLSCAGCMEHLACNYDATATKNDGSCVFAGVEPCTACSWAGSTNPGDGSGTLVTSDSDGDGVCDSVDLCSNTAACNYDAASNLACVLKVTYYADEDGDGIGDYSLGSFCASEQPVNSTSGLDGFGNLDNCTDANACNYNDPVNGSCAADSDLDGECDLTDNCTNTQAPNYDAAANTACCTDANGNGVCDDREVFGCRDATACNYFLHANLDDGSCKYHTASTSSSSSGTSQYSLSLDDNSCDTCTPADSTVTLSNSVAILLGIGTTHSIGRYTDNDSDDDGVCDPLEVVGCNDSLACNYSAAVTEPCFLDADLGYGVTPRGVSCSTLYCKYEDACGVCGGSGVDTDDDGVCDNTPDLCTNPLACNFSASPTAACKFLNDCAACVAGLDANNDGFVDGDTSDADGDGVCDTSDLCTNTAACNYDASPTAACKFLNDCGACVAGLDADNDGLVDGDASDSDSDGLCDTADNCTDVSACNYNAVLYPANTACLTDADADGICDSHEVLGCTTATACNYNAAATDHNAALCRFASAACEACAGNPSNGSGTVVLTDSDGDGVCNSSDLCSDVTVCNYAANPSEPCGTDADRNGVCDLNEILGCRNAAACNYHATATRDNASCIFPSGCATCSGATDGTGTVLQGDSDFDGVCNAVDNCSDITACNYIAASSANAVCAYATAGYSCAGFCITDTDLDGLCDYLGQDLCTDQQACNFNDPANVACRYRNTCGVCGELTPGVAGFDPTVYCDCDFNVRDILNNCGGGCTADTDADGICDDIDPCLIAGQVPDACGVCGGPGAIYACGCFELPSDACSCQPNGTVSYPEQGKDCNGNCLYGTYVDNGVTLCKFFDNAEVTVVPEPIKRQQVGSSAITRIDALTLEEWLAKFDTLHNRMSQDLDDGSLTGAAERLTIEEKILDKGELSVLGKTHLSGFVQMDSNVVILGNLVVERDATIKGTTFSLGGIETAALNMSGDLSVGGATVIDSTLEVLQSTLLHDSLTVLGRLTVGRNRVFNIDTFGNTVINGEVTILDSLVATSAGTRLSNLTAESTSVASLTTQGDANFKNDIVVNGDAQFNGQADLEGDLNVNGSFDVQGPASLTSIASASIANAGNISSETLDVADSLSTGELVVANNASTSTLSVASTANFNGTLSVLGNAASPLFVVGRATSNGALGQANLPGNLHLYASPAAYTSNPASPTLSLTAAGAISATGAVAAKAFNASSATDASTFAGALRVLKATELNEGLLVKANGANALSVANATGLITLETPTQLNGNTSLAAGKTLSLGAAAAGANLSVYGNSLLSTLTVNGAATFNASIAFNSTAAFNSTVALTNPASNLKVAGQLVVGSSSEETPENYLAYFDAGAGGAASNQGIAIRLNHANDQARNEDHFVSFLNKNGTSIGRIQGEYSGDWQNDRGKKMDYDQHVVETTQAWTAVTVKGSALVATAAIATYQVVSQLAHLIPDSWMVFWPSIDFGDIPAAIGNAVTAASKVQTDVSDLVLTTAEAVAESAFMGVWNDINSSELGVAYSTGNGDYAEWIPRVNSKEEMHAGQIVAVRRGQLSLRTDDFDHLLVISSAPAVLGKMPAGADTDDYEKVAFLGQVPVELIGTAKSGDYILPSGDHDGFGIAVDPADIAPDQIPYIVGVAWEDGTNEFYNIVNVVVGLRSKAQENAALDAFEREMDDVALRIEQLKGKLTRPMDTPAPTAAAAAPASAATAMAATPERPSPVRTNTTRPAAPAAPIALTLPEGTDKPTGNGKPAGLPSPLLAAAYPTTREDAELVREDLVESFLSEMTTSLDGVASLEDLTQLALTSGATSGTPYPAMENAIANFSDRILRNEFSTANIEHIVRTHISGNPTYAQLGNLQPGSRAEQQFVDQIQAAIFESLRSTKK